MAKTPKKDTKPTAPVFGEVASSGPGLDLSGFVGEIRRPTDELLSSLGGDLVHYERLLRDDQVHSTFQQRRRAVTSREWEVVAGGDAPADEEAAAFLEENLRAAKWDRVTDRMLYGLFYGYAVAEILWGRDGNRIVIDAIKVRKAKRFRFDRDGALRLLKPGNPQGEIMPERKFWTFSTGADNDDDPYGRGLGHYLYWPVFLKRNGAQFWALALEKYGGPTALGKYPAGTSEADKKKLLETLHAMRTDSAVVIPDGMVAELLEAVKQSGGDFSAFLGYWDGAIAKVILSQTMTTDSGSSLSQASIHMEVRDDVVKGDADLVCEAFNDGPAVWLTEWNFPGAAPPRVWRIIEEPEDLKVTAERDQLVAGMGFEPSEEYIRGKYGDGWAKKTAPPPPIAGPAPAGDEPAPAFAEPGARDETDDLVDQLDAVATPVLSGMVEDIRRVIETSASFEEAAERLATLFPGKTPGDLEEMLAGAMMTSDLQGAADVG